MISVRTCLGCRQRAPQSELLRVVARDGVVVADFSAQLAGRGAWVHPTFSCVTTSVKRKAFGRALRVLTALDTGDLIEKITPVPTQQDEATVTN